VTHLLDLPGPAAELRTFCGKQLHELEHGDSVVAKAAQCGCEECSQAWIDRVSPKQSEARDG
jgi:hypothetical protein